jgi:hypothetical protein
MQEGFMRPEPYGKARKVNGRKPTVASALICQAIATLGGKPGNWMLGWDGVNPYPTDSQVSATTLRHGNIDYVTNTVHGIRPSTITRCRTRYTYCSRYTWPWVDPVGATKLFALPAKALRPETPFTQP